jgi:serine protease
MTAWAFLLGTSTHSFASGLSASPEDPPVRGPRSEAGRLTIRFPGVEVDLETDDAAVVTVRRGIEVPADLRAEGRALGRAERHWLVPATAAEDPLDVALRWAAQPAVEAAIPDLWMPARPMAFDDPVYPGQWYMESLGMEPLFERTLGDPAIRIAVIDSGIEIAHPDLQAAVVEPFDAIDGDDDPSPVPGEDCPSGGTDICDTHGTSVAGITTARANNGVGIVGLCPECSLVPIRMLGSGAPLSAEITSFEHAIEADAAVINNSWGFLDPVPAPAPLAEVIGRAVTETRGGLGSVVVFAAGNEDRVIQSDEMVGLPGVVCVSAIDSYDLPTAFTNEGAPVDLAAPSATVTLAPNGGTTETFGGTSAAAPVVSGLAGWIASVDPTLSAAEIGAVLIETAHPTSLVTFDANGHHPVYGNGILDPAAILERLFPTEAPPVEGEEPPKGCGCGSTSGGWLGLALVGLLWRRR